MLNKLYHSTMQRPQQGAMPVPLPGINETFPQFNRSAISLLASPPLDLSLRAPNIITITPPSTPSPPRKRSRLMLCDEMGAGIGTLWRPHALPIPANSTANSTALSHTIATTTATMTIAGLEAVTTGVANSANATATVSTTTTISSLSASCMATNCLDSFEIANSCGGGGGGDSYRRRNFVEIPANQLGVQTTFHTSPRIYPTICVDDDDDDGEEGVTAEDVEDGEIKNEDDDDDDETIILTEDETDEMTVVSSHGGYTTATELTNDCDMTQPTAHADQKSVTAKVSSHGQNEQQNEHEENDPKNDDDEEDEYVDILSNDDDDVNVLSANAMLRTLQSQVYEAELERSGKVLTRNKRCYDDLALHNQAVDGLAKLFELSLDNVAQKLKESSSMDISQAASPIQNKTYIDLSADDQLLSESPLPPVAGHLPPSTHSTLPSLPLTDFSDLPMTMRSTNVTAPQRSERKRTKLRKNLNVDEETISPVSGTIIRKLRDGEHLVVRKGDIDPAFNVVEITEEAKAILASIDNKIGAYLCQLCRTVYDDAFMLAQHRCPRIVHIEYKCSECEKVFNCPANLASHRRWHKPKSELHASVSGSSSSQHQQQKKRQSHQHDDHIPDKSDDGTVDGIFPCTQCGKTFRRQAYLKKHQVSHQMLENLKTLELFKSNATNLSTATTAPHQTSAPPTTNVHPTPLNAVAAAAAATAYHTYPQAVNGSNGSSNTGSATEAATTSKSTYPANHRIAPPFPFAPPTHFDQRRFYTLSEFYLSQQQQQQQQRLERNSAFQYVQANHLCQLNGMSSSFVPKLAMPTLGMPLPVK